MRWYSTDIGDSVNSYTRHSIKAFVGVQCRDDELESLEHRDENSI